MRSIRRATATHRGDDVGVVAVAVAAAVATRVAWTARRKATLSVSPWRHARPRTRSWSSRWTTSPFPRLPARRARRPSGPSGTLRSGWPHRSPAGPRPRMRSSTTSRRSPSTCSPSGATVAGRVPVAASPSAATAAVVVVAAPMPPRSIESATDVAAPRAAHRAAGHASASPPAVQGSTGTQHPAGISRRDVTRCRAGTSGARCRSARTASRAAPRAASRGARSRLSSRSS